MGLFTRGKAGNDESLAKMREDIKAIQGDIRDLQDVLEELHAKHLRLRGTVYAYRLHKPADDEEPAPRTSKEAKAVSKEELRRSLFHSGRIVPGKPTVHSNGDE